MNDYTIDALTELAFARQNGELYSISKMPVTVGILRGLYYGEINEKHEPHGWGKLIVSFNSDDKKVSTHRTIEGSFRHGMLDGFARTKFEENANT